MLETLQIIVLFCTVNGGTRHFPYEINLKKKCIKEIYICLDKNKSNEGLKECLTQ